jgi:hypothetical protein
MNKTAYAQRKSWLRNLNVGDEIAIPLTTTGTDRGHMSATVVRMTATQLVAVPKNPEQRALHPEVRVYRTDGDVVGNRVLFIRQPSMVRMEA